MNALHDGAGRVRGFLKVFRDATARHEEAATLDFLRRLTETVIDQRDPDAIVETGERLLGEHLGASRVLFAEADAAGMTVTVRRDWTRGLASLVGVHRVADFGPRALADFAAGTAHVSRDAERDCAPGEGLEATRAIGALAGVSIPVLKDGRFSFLFVVHQDRPRDWKASEVDLVRQVADRMVAEVERARAEAALREANRTLEARVEARTAELRNAVAEAEAFNYSISHDLRTPLRAMVSTSSILLEEAGPALDGEHRELLERQVHNANRLGKLIDELLRLSRLARAEVRRVPLDLAAEARAAFDELARQDRTNGCLFAAPPSLPASGDPELVATVLHNLLGNACKFSPAGGTVRLEEADGVFAVRDEGIGFDMAHATRMFLPFERLVAEGDFPGTGIGLANVERIVRRHGGRVWAESEPGRGAAFFFTLEPAEGAR